jgi:hypothetical protein
MPQMVRASIMARNLPIRSLGPCRNGKNRINEGFSSIKEIRYTIVYLLHQLLHQKHFCKLYPSQLIATALCLLRPTPILFL